MRFFVRDFAGKQKGSFYAPLNFVCFILETSWSSMGSSIRYILTRALINDGCFEKLFRECWFSTRKLCIAYEVEFYRHFKVYLAMFGESYFWYRISSLLF